MAERGRFSIDELKRIGWRIKSVRSLTGLNQEDFSLRGDIPYMTLKGWELGRALPRQDGLQRIIVTLDVHGIQVTPEWLIFGDGNGPVYGTRTTFMSAEASSLDLSLNAFKSEQRQKGHNPIIVRIEETSMSPRYRIGDMVGGIILSFNDLRVNFSSEEIAARAWLIPIASSQWVVRDIFFNSDRIFIKPSVGANIVETNSTSIGKIIWHYFPGEQT